MSNAIKIYQDIITDLDKIDNNGFLALNRSILLKNKIRIVYIVTAKYRQRIIAIMIPEGYKKEPINRFPKWHGIEFAYNNISEYKNTNSESEYIIITQAKNYDSGIFEIIANDITEQLGKVTLYSQMISKLTDTLGRWKKFFSINSDVVMTEQMQEGLYGELIVLQRLIYIFGYEAINYWCGADKETHDFYVNDSALEVKTTASKSNEIIKISSEHQLNPNDVKGTLFLYVNKIRKSHSDGETLPQIVKNIIGSISETYENLFLEKLFQYGYIPSCEEKYTIGFHLRSKQIFKVQDDFPSILPNDLDKGISDVVYSLDLNVCSKYIITWSDVEEILMGGIPIGES